jgi:hypothetical protein
MPVPPRAPYPFEIRRSAIQGRGAFATRRIEKGERIIEYTGERISNAEADARYDDDRMRRHHTYLFTLTQRTVVDGGAGGNEARLINHSCEPNCEAVIEDGRIWIEALRRIPKGQELTYDYKYERVGDDDEADEQKYPCRCGASRCRGTILLPRKRNRRKPKR